MCSEYDDPSMIDEEEEEDIEEVIDIGTCPIDGAYGKLYTRHCVEGDFI